MRNLLAPLIFLAVLLLVPRGSDFEAAEFQKAPDACSNAHAILGWSDFKQGPEESAEDFEKRVKAPWVKVGWVVGRLNWGRAEDKQQLKMVDEAESGVYGQAAFKEYKVEGHDNGKAYVAHCGHGGTCNMIAARVFRIYKGIGKPIVYCGKEALPKMLHSPSRPEITIPDDEELAEADDWGDDDDDFGDDDDGDDDDDDDDAKKKKKDEPSADDF